MTRFIVAVVALIVGIWVLFAVIRAVSAFIHLALILAIIVVALGLINAIRHRTTPVQY